MKNGDFSWNMVISHETWWFSHEKWWFSHETWWFPMKHGDFSWNMVIFPWKMVISHETWWFLMKHGDFPMKNGDFPMKHGDFPWNMVISHETWWFPMKNGDFPMKHGDLNPPIKLFLVPRCETRPWLPSRWLGEKPGLNATFISAWCSRDVGETLQPREWKSHGNLQKANENDHWNSGFSLINSMVILKMSCTPKPNG